MAEIITASKEYGWLVAVLIWLIYQGVTRLYPQWFAARRENHKSEQNQHARLDDRIFDLQEKTLIALSDNTHAIQLLTQKFDSHLGAMTRALDRNTLAITALNGPHEKKNAEG